MEYDSLGLVFAGMAIAFLIFILFGHKRREHMSIQNSPWDTIRYELETELSKGFDFDVAKFRRDVIDQNTFFDETEKPLMSAQKLITVPLTKPLVSEVKNTNKLFDEKLRILRSEYDKHKSEANIIGEVTTKMGISFLLGLAKVYMFNKSNASKFKPKSTVDKVSTSVSASITKLIG